MILEIALIIVATTVIIQGLHINVLSRKLNEIEYLLFTPSEEMEQVKEDLKEMTEQTRDDE